MLNVEAGTAWIDDVLCMYMRKTAKNDTILSIFI